MVNIGERIKELRLKNKMSQQELADKLFVSDKTVSSWESNRTEPDIYMLSDICKILNINFLSFINEGNNSNIELELKIRSNEHEQNRILNMIKDNSRFVNEEYQEAIYFKLSHRDMNKEWLRIRRENSNYILNYKKLNSKNLLEEYEVSIDNLENLKIIFNCIDLKESVHVNKNRKIYMYKDKYEFSFDDVENLGYFIEIEIKKYDYDLDKETEMLFNLLKELRININDIELKRYPELLEELD